MLARSRTGWFGAYCSTQPQPLRCLSPQLALLRDLDKKTKKKSMILANINVLVITISIVDVTYEAYTHFGLQKQGDRMQVVPAS